MVASSGGFSRRPHPLSAPAWLRRATDRARRFVRLAFDAGVVEGAEPKVRALRRGDLLSALEDLDSHLSHLPAPPPQVGTVATDLELYARRLLNELEPTLILWGLRKSLLSLLEPPGDPDGFGSLDGDAAAELPKIHVRVLAAVEHVASHFERWAAQLEANAMEKPESPGRSHPGDGQPSPEELAKILEEHLTPAQKAALRSERLTAARLGAILDVRAAETQSEQPPNGPGTRFRFFWAGDSVSFADAPYRYHLCVALWDRTKCAPVDERKESDVIREVYGEQEARLKKDLKDVVKEVNRQFGEMAWNIKIRRAGAKLWFEASP
jgi:hypothetical protein